MAAPWANRIIGYGTLVPGDVVANPVNWRTHPRAQLKALAAVLDRVGWVQDIVINQRTGHLIDGHARVALAIERGESTVPAVYVDLSEDDEKLILATLDPLSALATTNEAALSALLAGLPSTDEAVSALLQSITPAAVPGPDAPFDGATDPDDAPMVPRTPVSKPGDLWALGTHRVLCGDATDPAAVTRLLNEHRADAMWCDPPYGVGYTGGTAEQLRIDNDRADGLAELLRGAFAAADIALTDGAAIYVAHPSGHTSRIFLEAFEAAGWHLHEGLVWVKDAFVLGHSDYHHRHELIAYGWRGRHRWLGGRDQDSVFEVPRPRRSAEHPTQKPIALVEAHLRNSTERGALIYDPFAGSGTTLIAAHRLGRRAAAVEIDPRYTDVIVQRYEAYAGEAARLVGDGRTFAEIAAVRRGR